MSEPTPATDAAMPLLRIEDLTKTFDELEVLHETNLDVADKETVAVIGASGSGKTTMLRCVNYLERPTTGGIYLKGEPIGGKPKILTGVSPSPRRYHSRALISQSQKS